MITGTVVIDISQRDKNSRPHFAAQSLAFVPDGVRVVVVVNASQPYDPWTHHELRRHAERLVLDFHGDANSVAAWINAVRGDAS